MGERASRHQVFLDTHDEKTFSEALLAAIPGIRFVDGQRWPSPDPPLIQSIDQAWSPEAFLWDPNVAASLPFRRRDTGDYQGPVVGPVIQLDRCRHVGNELRSGSVAATYRPDDTTSAAFVRVVHATLRGMTSTDVVTLLGVRARTGSARALVVGPSRPRIIDSATAPSPLRISPSTNRSSDDCDVRE
jgi:hypothetical protein